MLRDEIKAVFDDCHHAEAKEVDFDDLHSRAVFLIPLDDGATGHGGAFQRNDLVKHAKADDHAPGVLAEMTGQVLHAQAELEIL